MSSIDRLREIAAKKRGTLGKASPPDDPPSNKAPSNEAPSNEAPSNEAPSNEAPSNEAPSNEAPSNEAPSNEAAPNSSSSQTEKTEKPTMTSEHASPTNHANAETAGSLESLALNTLPQNSASAANQDFAITSEASAHEILAALFSKDVATAIADIEVESANREQYPFAFLRKGNWEISRQIPEEFIDHMPVGHRPYRIIYLGYRLGVTSWPIKNAVGGEPPLWAAAIPSPAVKPEALTVMKKLLRASAKVQFTSEQSKHKFAGVGKITPEIHIFGWRPGIGYVVLICRSYNSVEHTRASLESAHKYSGVPVIVEVKTEKIQNLKTSDPKRREWEIHYLSVSVSPDDAAKKLAADFSAYKQTSIKEIATECLKFATTEDYQGLSLEEIEQKLDDCLAIE